MSARIHAFAAKTPRAPSQDAWDALSAQERERVVAALPSDALDGEMALPDGMPHMDPKIEAAVTLREFYKRIRRSVLVAVDLMVYYPGETRFSPDLLAVCDVETHPRDKWVVSAEGRGLDFALEILVKGDPAKDLADNVVTFARLGIPEYFVFDRRGPRLLGFRLPGKGRTYQPIVPQLGILQSEVLGLGLAIPGGELRFFRDGAPLPGHEELLERVQRLANEAVAAAERRAEEEAAARQQEAAARQQEAAARQQEAKARAEAEQRAAELSAELEKLRRKT